MSLRIGFIGLGNQGKPIAAHFAPQGFETVVFDVAPDPVSELVAGGARAAQTPKEVGQNADLVGLCVPEDKHVLSVVFGEANSGGGGGGLLDGMDEGGILLLHSTILPATVTRVAEAAAEKGIEVLDACVTGGAMRAEARQLTYLVGGSEAAFAKAQPYFDATTDVTPIHAGELGNGAKLKLCVNLITYIQWAAAFESMALAKAAGLPQEVLEAAGRSNGQMTDMMQQFLALHKTPPEVQASDAVQEMVGRNMHIAEKDLAWALSLARESGVTLPVGGLVSQSMARIYGVLDENRR